MTKLKIINLLCYPPAAEPNKGALIWSGSPKLQILEIHGRYTRIGYKSTLLAHQPPPSRNGKKYEK